MINRGRPAQVQTSQRAWGVRNPQFELSLPVFTASRCGALLQAMGLAAGFAVAAALSESSALAGQSVNRKLNPGDIIYADSGDAVHGGFIIKIDASSGEQTVLSSGGYLQLPFDPVVDATGEITVSDSGRLIGINPETGTQSIIADKTRGALGLPYGI